jgi:streptomycin 3"-adenylyltransferase
VSARHGAADHLAAQANAAVAVLGRTLPADLVLGVYLYGSAVTEGLRTDSDLDLFGVLARPLTEDEKRTLVEGLVPISWRRERPAAWRPLELTLVVRDDVNPWRYPPRFDFQYGEWLREKLVAGNLAPWPHANPDLAIQVTMVRSTGRALVGPPPAELLAPVPREDVVHAILDELPSLLEDLGSDTRNVLLTLARMWTTIASGEVRSKDAAARWALARLPASHRPPLAQARAAYVGSVEDSWHELGAARSLANELVTRIRDASRMAPQPRSPGTTSPRRG